MPDPIDALERSYEQLAKVVANLSPGQLALRTSCPDWDVRALLDHTLGAGLMYALVNEGQVAGEDQGDVAGDDPVGAVARTAEVNLASWRAAGALDGERAYPWGTLPAGAGLLSNLGEVAVHAWDEPGELTAGLRRAPAELRQERVHREQSMVVDRLAPWIEKFPDVVVNRRVTSSEPRTALHHLAAGAALLVLGRGALEHPRVAVLGSTAAVLSLSIILACLAPAYRATRVDPMRALGQE